MFYFFYGSDVKTSVDKARALAKALRTKKPDAAYTEMDADRWDPTVIEEQTGGQGLFSVKSVVLLNRITENVEAKEKISDLAKQIKDSDNIFIIIEGKLNAELKKVFEKYAEKTVISEPKEPRTAVKGDFNIFTLANALGSRDAFKSWSVYRQATDYGLEPENIIGVLFWKVKSMILAKDTRSYSTGELESLLGSLVKIYHDGHRGLRDTGLAMEQLLLSLR